MSRVATGYVKKLTTPYYSVVSIGGGYMYIRDNGVPIGQFGRFGGHLQTCFGVLAVRSEVQTQG